MLAADRYAMMMGPRANAFLVFFFFMTALYTGDSPFKCFSRPTCKTLANLDDLKGED